jgi:hypothetical protein
MVEHPGASVVPETLGAVCESLGYCLHVRCGEFLSAEGRRTIKRAGGGR